METADSVQTYLTPEQVTALRAILRINMMSSVLDYGRRCKDNAALTGEQEAVTYLDSTQKLIQGLDNYRCLDDTFVIVMQSVVAAEQKCKVGDKVVAPVSLPKTHYSVLSSLVKFEYTDPDFELMQLSGIRPEDTRDCILRQIEGLRLAFSDMNLDNERIPGSFSMKAPMPLQ